MFGIKNSTLVFGSLTVTTAFGFLIGQPVTSILVLGGITLIGSIIRSFTKKPVW